MLLTALTLIAVGVLSAAGAVAPCPFDFAVALAPGWHVTVFPLPLWVGVLLILTGVVALLASVQWR